MKKGIIIGTLAGAAILGFGVYQSSASEAIEHDPKLSHDEVKEIIEIEYPGNITEFELDTEDGRVIYEIEIKDEDVKYDLDVDANTGEVIKVDEKKYKQNKKNTDKVTETKLEDIISVEEAEAIAQKEFSGTVTQLELDKDDGRYVYEIELRNGNQEAEMDIDAKTGKILELELEYEDD